VALALDSPLERLEVTIHCLSLTCPVSDDICTTEKTCHPAILVDVASWDAGKGEVGEGSKFLLFF
jgi:hypothetical protein